MQIAKLIPSSILNRAVEETKADAYYKNLTTQKQLVCLLYGVITKCDSFNSLCKNLLFLDKKLTSIGISELPARSTLGDANTNRYPVVYELIYKYLQEHYKGVLQNETYSFISDIDGLKKIEIIDSSTISLFSGYYGTN